ncbi:MAG: ergothioneine biosynthesis protein EgtB [Pseudomonadota bacterium]
MKNSLPSSATPLPSPYTSALAARFIAVRQQTEHLAKPLSAEDCQLQSMPDTSPTKWHLAHITWFFETFLLERFEENFKPFDAGFRVLFNSYYNGVGDKYPRPKRGLISRPSLREVLNYRAQVNQRMLETMAHVQAHGSAQTQKELEELVTLGLHHEQQHQELLLTDIKHALSFNPGRPAYAKRWPLAGVHPQPASWIAHAGGLIEHGFDATRDGAFAFDNETPRHRYFVQPFELASRPVTNGEMMAFMADGGYERPELWLSMGWDWVQAGAHDMPLYWQRAEAEDAVGYRHFTLQGLVDVDANTPVCHLSYFEADAFARWAGARLPTEFEWELAARSLPPTPSPQGNFVENAAFHPLPQHDGHSGHPMQMFGDVWEWTQSNYNPYPGYKPWEGLVGEYNGKFMCNQFVLRGGSCATPQSHIRASYRNFFPPDAQWQFSGLRLARDAA